MDLKGHISAAKGPCFWSPSAPSPPLLHLQHKFKSALPPQAVVHRSSTGDHTNSRPGQRLEWIGGPIGERGQGGEPQTWPVDSTTTNFSSAVHPNPTMEPCSQETEARGCPAALKIAIVGFMEAPVTTTTWRSSLVCAIGPPWLAHATLQQFPWDGWQTACQLLLMLCAGWHGHTASKGRQGLCPAKALN